MLIRASLLLAELVFLSHAVCMHFLMQNDAIFCNFSQIGLFGTLTVNTFDIAPGWNRTSDHRF